MTVKDEIYHITDGLCHGSIDILLYPNRIKFKAVILFFEVVIKL